MKLRGSEGQKKLRTPCCGARFKATIYQVGCSCSGEAYVDFFTCVKCGAEWDEDGGELE